MSLLCTRLFLSATVAVALVVAGCARGAEGDRIWISATINGKGRGQGILLVNGDLKINGTFDWVGLIIVRDDINKGNGDFTTRPVFQAFLPGHLFPPLTLAQATSDGIQATISGNVNFTAGANETSPGYSHGTRLRA